jgi:serine/threonine-protein kinase HipA
MVRAAFGRAAFGYTHARNHAALWDGKTMSLTPAYDICPQGRSGNEASQAMLIVGDKRSSQLETCLEAAHDFLLSEKDARSIFEMQKDLISCKWTDVCDEAGLSPIDRALLWGRQFLNPYSTVHSTNRLADLNSTTIDLLEQRFVQGHKLSLAQNI